jgi:MinD-like ATPase involved in chromosome partitioning or flagellar assembly
VALELAQRRSVVLAELRPGDSSLAGYFRPQRSVRTLEDVASSRAADVRSCLWPVHRGANLSVLFAPRAGEGWAALDPARGSEIMHESAQLSDAVIVDLPSGSSPFNRAVSRESDVLCLVTKRDPLSVESAKAILRHFEQNSALPQTLGVVVVNHAAVGLPLPLPEIESQLSIPMFGVIPPAPDLCLLASSKHEPAIHCDPGGVFARSLMNLAAALPL